MKIDAAYILCAGQGTRMGLVGKVLPKALWPIENTSFLDYKISRLKAAGIEKIIINTHWGYEYIHSYLEKLHPDVIILHEPELLGSGGCIHNLKSSPLSSGIRNLLVLNCDIFLSPFDSFMQFIQSYQYEDDIILFTMNVEKGDGYNGLDSCQSGQFLGVIPNKDCPANYETFTGVSIVNLDCLDLQMGISSFFNSVALPGERSIKMINIDQFDYLDLGTVELFIKYNAASAEQCRGIIDLSYLRSNDFKELEINHKVGVVSLK